MQTYGVCQQCGSPMAILDMMLEGYDLVCVRCGVREVVNRSLREAPPCYQ